MKIKHLTAELQVKSKQKAAQEKELKGVNDEKIKVETKLAKFQAQLEKLAFDSEYLSTLRSEKKSLENKCKQIQEVQLQCLIFRE